MLLEKNMTFALFSKVRPVFILAGRDQRPPHLRPPLVFNHFEAVHPMLHPVPVDNNPRAVPLADAVESLPDCRDEIIETPERPVAAHAELRIGMLLIVQNLEFASDRRTL